MLQNNLELIVQFPYRSGYCCRGFRGLHLSAPVYVVFDGADVSDQAVANLLGMAFCQEVLRYAGVNEEAIMPCKGHSQEVYCHAKKEPTCKKILVRPAATGGLYSTGYWPNPSGTQLWLKNLADPKWEVIPTMPMGTTVQKHVPVQWQGINVNFWHNHPSETIWAVMQRAGLTPVESRIFISYVRRDTTAVADQLFEALTKEGFDVFLDRYSVPIGVDFQKQLMQEICDKAMVILLNSKSLPLSRWVEEEIATIKTYRLGLLELCFPDGIERPDIDRDLRHKLNDTDLKDAGADYANGSKKLVNSSLAFVVNQIKKMHGLALHRRRYELINNFGVILGQAGKTSTLLSDGSFLVSEGSPTETIVGLAVRPPELDDFCSLHQRNQISTKRAGWIVSPSPLFLARRQAQISWLGDISNIHNANEAQMTDLVKNL